MTDGLELELFVLGPLEARTSGRPLALGGPRQRALLARLIVSVGEVVPAQRLIDDVWDAAPPASGANTLHVHIARLRRTLGRAVLKTVPPGYALRVAADRIDARRFETAVTRATRLAPATGASELRDALSLWRGPPLADVAEPFARVEAARLQELRLLALEAKVDAELALGRHRELVPELENLVAAEPLCERIRAQLMTALYRSGRQADALRVFREGRRTLVAELGIEPAPLLRRLEQAILAQDPSLDLE
jgi:DNA-binding SARP family transcriptional activator